MNTTTVSSRVAAPGPEDGKRGTLNAFGLRLLQAQAPLVRAALVLLAAMIPTLLLMLLDPRQLSGVGVWVKPWKFQLSTGTYLLTLAWIMLWLAPRQRQLWAGRYVAWVAIASAGFEVAYISWQAAWGRASHFNVATTHDAVMYSLMGLGAVLLTSTALVLGVMVLRGRSSAMSRVMQQAVGWGLVMTCVLGTGFGVYLSAQTGHAVAGSSSDAGGMVLTGWSRSGGDLRVAHFFGIHAVHVMVLFGWLLDRWSRHGVARGAVNTDRARGAVIAVWLFGAAYGGFSCWTLIQAIGGRPFMG